MRLQNHFFFKNINTFLSTKCAETRSRSTVKYHQPREMFAILSSIFFLCLHITSCPLQASSGWSISHEGVAGLFNAATWRRSFAATPVGSHCPKMFAVMSDFLLFFFPALLFSPLFMTCEHSQKVTQKRSRHFRIVAIASLLT